MAAKWPARVLIIAECAVVRAGLHALLRAAEGIVVAGEAADVREACAAIRREAVDVVVLDVRGGSAGDLQRCLGRTSDPRVLVITPRVDEETMVNMVMDGAAGYLFEDVDAPALQEAIRTLMRGGSPMDPQMASALAGRLRLRALGPRSPWAPLTIDEYDVLERIVRGETNRQIGCDLHLDDRVVKHRVSAILRKIGAKNRVAAAAWCARRQQEGRADV